MGKQVFLIYTDSIGWDVYAEKAGVRKFGLHSIRHLTASILSKANISMIDIQTILRHKNLATIERYIRRLLTVRPALRVLPGRKSSQATGAAHTTKKREPTAIS